MGCQVSTQNKVLPLPTAPKIIKKKSSLHVAIPRSEPSTPKQDRFGLFQGKNLEAESISFQMDSRKSFANFENHRIDPKKDKTTSPMIRIIGIGSSRQVISSEESFKRTESLDVSPADNISPKKEFTFQSGDNSIVTMSVESLSARNKQPSRFLTINSKPSEFYLQKHLSDKNLIKLGTFGSARTANEDHPKLEEVTTRRKSVVKSMGEIQVNASSLNIGEHESVFPDTPGFRSLAASGMMRLSFGPTNSNQSNSNKDDNSRLPPFRGSTFGMRDSMASLSKHVESEIDSGDIPRPIDRRKSDTELKGLTSVVSLGDPMQMMVVGRGSKEGERIQGPILKIPLGRDDKTKGNQAPDQEQEVVEGGTIQKRRSHRFATVHQINVTAVTAAAELAEQQTKLLKIESVGGDSEHKESKTSEKTPAGIHKVMIKKGFTTNLLDLVNIRKDSTPTTAPEEQTTQKQTEIQRKLSTEISEELNTLSLIQPEGIRRGSVITSEMLPRSRGTETDNGRLAPLKLGSIEFMQNCDGVSPIEKAYLRTENVTPNSNRTMFMKQFLGVMDLQEDRTITNLDYLSRGDFDKYSFMAEVKEVEFNNNNNNTSQDDFANRNGSRKQTGQTSQTNKFRTLGSQDLLSPGLKMGSEFNYS